MFVGIRETSVFQEELFVRDQIRAPFHQAQVQGYDAKSWNILPMGCQIVVTSHLLSQQLDFVSYPENWIWWTGLGSQSMTGVITKFWLGRGGGADSGESKPPTTKFWFLLRFCPLWFGNIDKSKDFGFWFLGFWFLIFSFSFWFFSFFLSDFWGADIPPEFWTRGHILQWRRPWTMISFNGMIALFVV